MGGRGYVAKKIRRMTEKQLERIGEQTEHYLKKSKRIEDRGNINVLFSEFELRARKKAGEPKRKRSKS